MRLRARGNDIARDGYLYFARGAGLDHLGAFYDCLRMPGEGRERYQDRIILAIRGRSTGGTEPRYEAIAMGASLRVERAKAFIEKPSPIINIAVFATDNNGVGDQALLDQVYAAVTDRGAMMMNDSFAVRSAVVHVQNVVGRVRLLRTTPQSVLTNSAATLADRWKQESDLGRDLTRDWIAAAVMGSGGIYDVELDEPASDIIMGQHEAVRIGSVSLDFVGRAN